MIPVIVTLQMIAWLTMPPAEFDHYPTEPFKVIEVEARVIAALCPRAALALGCVFPGERKYYVRDDLSPAVRARVDRHEFGHLNGWLHQ